MTGVDLYWIPLGAGGSGVVRFNGRVYERITALMARRQPLELYHTALRVHLPEGSFVVETMWPSPRGEPSTRGVVIQAPVFLGPLGRIRVFRYEVRRWRDGDLPDAGEAVGGPRRLGADPDQGRVLLELTARVPPLIWGRDQQRAGEMWNSNSVISWLLTRSGFPMERIAPPSEGRAPGWDAGIVVARCG